MAKKIIAIDLGITTGYAVFSGLNTEPIEYGEIAEDDLEPRLKQLLTGHMISYSVCEKPVIIRGSLGDRLQVLIWTVERVFMRQVKMVGPAQWKQTPFKSSPCPRGTSTHVKDAIRLGLWFQNSLKDSLQGH